MSPHYTPESSGLQEVLYLHALWHGQVRQPLPQLLSPNPRPAAAFKNNRRKKTNRRPSDAPSSFEIKRPIARSSPPPSASKKRKKTNHRSSGAPSTAEIQRPIAGSNPPPSASNNKKRKKKQPDAPAAVEIEWPCPPGPITKTVGWDDLAPSRPPAPPLSAEDQARAAALLAQRPGLRACQEFFSSKKNGSDDEDGEEDDLIDGDGGGSFLLGLFEKDGDLRGYYEKNCDRGEFCCLVCWGIGEKKGKRFPDCVGLVQHCNSISKTKRKGAHRGLAKAVCRVLAWDIKRLPSIVLDLADPLGKSLEKAAESKRESANDVVGELLKEACENAAANNGNLECTKTRELTNLSKEEHNGMK